MTSKKILCKLFRADSRKAKNTILQLVWKQNLKQQTSMIEDKVKVSFSFYYIFWYWIKC